MVGFLVVVAADLLAARDEVGLVTFDVVGFRLAFEPRLQRLEQARRGVVGTRPRLRDRFRFVGERRGVRTPQSARARLTVGGLEHAGRDLGGNQRRALDHVEGEGADRDLRLVAGEPLRPAEALGLDRLLADDVDRHFCVGSEITSPASVSLAIFSARSRPHSVSSPSRPLSFSGRPTAEARLTEKSTASLSGLRASAGVFAGATGSTGVAPIVAPGRVGGTAPERSS